MSASAALLTTVASRVEPDPVQSFTDRGYAMPCALQRLLAKVEARRCEIKHQAVWEGVKFWSLKVPAILAAVGSGITAALGEFGVSLAVLIALLGICVALDGMIHPGAHRVALLRASEGLRNLKDSIEFWWDELKDNSPDDAAAQIIAKAEKQWKKIADYVDGTLFAVADANETANNPG